MAEVTPENVPQKVRDMFNKGFSAFERGNLDYAIDLLTACTTAEPAFLQARKFLRSAEIQKYQKQTHSPLTHIMSLVTGLSMYLKTMAMLKSGKNLPALESAEKLLRQDPLNVRFIKLAAQAAVACNMPEAAILTLEVARDHYPDDITILNWLGGLYQKVGRMRSARECFEKLCEVCPNDPQALKSLKDAMALDSISTDGWGEAAEKGGSYRDMIKDTKEAVILEQESKSVKTDKDAESLIANFQSKIQQEPANVNYRRSLARLFAQVKRFDEAIATLQKAQELSPGDPELDNTLSGVRVEQFDQVVQDLQAAGDAAGAEAKEHEKKVFLFEDLQERVKRYPNDLKLRYEWGVMLLENGYTNEAIQQFQMAQRSPKHRTDALFKLAMCFKEKKQYDLAREQLEKAGAELYSMDETKKLVFYELGQIAETTGDPQKAIEHYKRIYQVDIGYKDVAEKVERLYRGEG